MQSRRPGVLLLLAAIALSACATPLELGERRYREGDRLAALDIWRGVRNDAPRYERAQERIREVEQEFDQLVVRYKKRGRYYERRGRLAESVLNYRLALKLQADDDETLAHVQGLVRELDTRTRAAKAELRVNLDAGDLASARQHLQALRTLDPFDAQLEIEERRIAKAVRNEIEGLLARGRRGFSSGDYRSAQQAFEEVLTLDPENDSAQGHLSFIETIRNEDSARVRGLDPPQINASEAQIRAEGFYRNALAAERAGNAYAAIRHDVSALVLDPDHAKARAHLAKLRRELRPGVPELIELGRVHFEEEDLQSALEEWRKALLIDPQNQEAREYVARAERMLQNLEQLRAVPTADLGTLIGIAAS